MGTDSPDLVIAKRLLDELKLCGFDFRRTAPGEDAPLVGMARRVHGSALRVLNEVLTWEMEL